MATIEEVLKAEQSELQKLRSRPEGKQRLKDKKVGLAFSGGGIRSATFHLGVLQTLAEYGLLKQFDYLSTVSGGGYIGSWLARWIQQEGISKVEQALPGGLQEAPEVNFLRDYSNFLTPRKGLFGADTWAAIATYLRNLLLNQAILISFLGAVLLFPWALGRAFAFGPYEGLQPMALGVIAGALITLAVACGVLNTSTCRGGKPKAFSQQRWVLATVVLPLFAGAFLLNYSIWRRPGMWTPEFSVVAGAAVYGMGQRENRMPCRTKVGASISQCSLGAARGDLCRVRGVRLELPGVLLEIFDVCGHGPLACGELGHAAGGGCVFAGRNGAHRAGKIRVEFRNARVVGAARRLADAVVFVLDRALRRGNFCSLGSRQNQGLSLGKKRGDPCLAGSQRLWRAAWVEQKDWRKEPEWIWRRHVSG